MTAAPEDSGPGAGGETAGAEVATVLEASVVGVLETLVVATEVVVAFVAGSAVVALAGLGRLGPGEVTGATFVLLTGGLRALVTGFTTTLRLGLALCPRLKEATRAAR